MTPMNEKGVSLTEILVVLAIAGIMSIFAFDSVQQVVQASLRVGKKNNFNGLMNDIRFVTGRLDQCTCNFTGRTWNVGAASVNLGGTPQVLSYTNPVGPPACGGATTLLAQQGGTYQNTIIDTIELIGVQHIPLMGILRARLNVEGRTRASAGPNTPADSYSSVSRQIPLMFSATQAGGTVTINGCIGMTN